MEFVFLLIGLFVWFVLGVISIFVAHAVCIKQHSVDKYKLVNNAGKKRSYLKLFFMVTILGPYIGVVFYYVSKTSIYIKQGKLVVVEKDLE